MILETDRLTLRPMREGDAPALFAILSDRHAMRFWDRPAIARLAVTQDMVAEQLAWMARGECRYWTLWREDDALGSIDLSLIRGRGAELGILIRRDRWGQGFGGEAVAAVLAHAFGPMGLLRVRARIHAQNLAAARLLTRAGFRLEESHPNFPLPGGGVRPCEIYLHLGPDIPAANKGA
jgi:RimJ/RimL family protein N-acetyltransferase